MSLVPSSQFAAVTASPEYREAASPATSGLRARALRQALGDGRLGRFCKPRRTVIVGRLVCF
jgi:hypothetical protein